MNDLVFAKYASNQYTLTTIAGGSALLSGSFTAKTVTLSASAIGTGATFALVNWDGTIESNGKPAARELVVAGSSGSYLYYSANLLTTGSTLALVSSTSFGAGFTVTDVSDTQLEGHDDVVFTNSTTNQADILYGGHTSLTSFTVAGSGTLSQAFRLGSLTSGAGSEFAIARAGTGATPAPQIDIFSVVASVVTLSQTINVSSSLSGGFAVGSSLSIAAGDFNGDGTIDLAIGQSGSSGAGKVYVLWSIVSQGATTTLSNSNLAFSGQTASGAPANSQFGTLSLSPDLDLNGDGFTQLIVGDQDANYSSTSGTYAGQLYVLRLSSTEDMARAEAAISGNTGTAILTNPSLTNPGDYLVASTTPFTQSATFAAGQTEAWYMFTTLGDGLGASQAGTVGNQIAVSPIGQASKTTTITPTSGFLTDASGTYQTTSSTTIGGSGQNIGVYNVDLSQFLPFINNTAGIESATMTLTASSPSGAAGSLLQLVQLNGKSDGIINTLDSTAVTSGPVTPVQSFVFGTGIPNSGGVLSSVNITQLIQNALAAGLTRLTFAATTTNAASLAALNMSLSIQTAVSGLVMDVYDGNGVKIDTGLPVVDMRHMPAGTYYLRLYNPAPSLQTAAMAYTITISPPENGDTGGYHTLTNNDVISYNSATPSPTVTGGTGVDEYIFNGAQQTTLATGALVDRSIQW